MVFKPGCRLSVVGALFAALLITPVQANAQAKAQDTAAIPTPAIAVIDVQAILRDSSAAKGIRGQRDKYLQTYQNEFSKEENALREADQELGRQRALLTPEAFMEKRRGFEQQVAEFQRRVQSKRRALEEAYNEAMTALQQGLIKVADEIAQERKANMVLFKSQVFLLDPAMEITEPAIERLDKRLPSVPFPTPKEKADAPAASPPAAAKPTKK